MILGIIGIVAAFCVAPLGLLCAILSIIVSSFMILIWIGFIGSSAAFLSEFMNEDIVVYNDEELSFL